MVASCTALAVLSLIAVHLHGLVLAVRALARRELPVFALVRGFLARRAHGVPQTPVVRRKYAAWRLRPLLPEPYVCGRGRGIANLFKYIATRITHHHFLRFLVPRCRHIIKAQSVLALHAAQVV